MWGITTAFKLVEDGLSLRSLPKLPDGQSSQRSPDLSPLGSEWTLAGSWGADHDRRNVIKVSVGLGTPTLRRGRDGWACVHCEWALDVECCLSSSNEDDGRRTRRVLAARIARRRRSCLSLHGRRRWCCVLRGVGRAWRSSRRYRLVDVRLYWCATNGDIPACLRDAADSCRRQIFGTLCPFEDLHKCECMYPVQIHSPSKMRAQIFVHHSRSSFSL